MRVAKYIILTYNVLVFTLLMTMYFTDTENGGLPFVLILFFTLLYDLYYWMAYSIVKRFVKKSEYRNWGMLLVALSPFIIIFMLISRPSARLHNESKETDTSAYEHELLAKQIDIQDSALYQLFKEIPVEDLRRRFRSVQTSGIVAERGKWSVPRDSGILYFVNWPDTSMLQQSRGSGINEAIFYNSTKSWEHPEKDDFIEISIVSHDIEVGPYSTGKREETLPLADFSKHNDTVFYKKDGLGTLLILGFSKKESLKFIRIGSYDISWLENNIERECDSFVSDFSRRMP
ncbi:MAG: hypothetical protein MJZ33_11860 [Paludibacteraceae bacterium]|nr:hypothetical protein [Paludibacteraceae bacterium]